MTKVLHIIGTYKTFTGMEKHVCDLANAQSSQPGYEVAVVCDKLIGGGLQAGVQQFNCNMHTHRRSPLLQWKILRIIKHYKPDIVHIHGRKALSLVSMAHYLNRKPLWLATVHNSRSDTSCFAKMDALIAVSWRVASALPNVPTRVIWNGCDLQQAGKLDADFNLPQAAPGALFKLLAIGRLDEVKGFDILINAMQGLKAMLYIIGDGPLEQKLKSQVQKLGLEQQVYFAGRQSNIRDWIDRADALVVSSLREGFSYVLVEALLAGCPVLGSDVADMRQVLDNELLCPPADHRALHELLARFCGSAEQKAKLLQLAATSFELAQKQLTLQSMLDKTLQFYKDRLQAKKA